MNYTEQEQRRRGWQAGLGRACGRPSALQSRLCRRRRAREGFQTRPLDGHLRYALGVALGPILATSGAREIAGIGLYCLHACGDGENREP
jgi:hypothetical protein